MALGNHEWARMLAEKDALVNELREKNDALAKEATDAQTVKYPTVEFLVQILNQLMIWLYPHENIPPLHVPLKSTS